MSKEELYEKIEACRLKVHTLSEEIKRESDISIILSKLEEMTELRDEAYRLSGVYKSILIAEYEAEVGKLTKQLQRDLILKD